jgi:hypothetical protein
MLTTDRLLGSVNVGQLSHKNLTNYPKADETNNIPTQEKSASGSTIPVKPLAKATLSTATRSASAPMVAH